MITYKTTKRIAVEQLHELFRHTDWVYEAEHSTIISVAISVSSNVISAWDDDKLVGIIRSMDDGIWSANIDCLVVHNDYCGKGIETELLTRLLQKLSAATFINAAPNERYNISFYEKNGFKYIEAGCLLQIDRS